MDVTKIPGAHIAVEVYDAASRFRDMLHIQFSEVAGLTDAQVAAKVAADSLERIENHKAHVIEQSSKPPVVPTKEQLTESATAQANQVEALTAQIVTAKMTALEVKDVISKLEASIATLKSLKAEVK